MLISMRRMIVALIPAYSIACIDGPSTGLPGPPSVPASGVLPRSEDATGSRQYLPYGRPIPPGQSVSLPPEPYDLAKHGPGLRNTSTMRQYSRRTEGVGAMFSAFSDDGDYQLSFAPSSPAQFFGVTQSHGVNVGLQLPVATGARRSLYAPTVLPPGGSCIEATTIYERNPGQPTVRSHGWYDWCNPSNFPVEDMNATFQAKYVRWNSLHARYTISVSIVTPNTGNLRGQCWFGQLYNYTVGGWEQKAAFCGYSRKPDDNGWSAWESYSLMSESCYFMIPGLGAYDIQLHLASDHQPHYVTDSAFLLNIGSGSNSAQCWRNFPTGNPNLFEYPVGGSSPSWRAHTPVP